MDVVTSVNGVPIRLTAERWMHIVEARDELAGRAQEVLTVVESPDWVTRSYRDSLVAWKGYSGKGYLAVIYKEIGQPMDSSLLLSSRGKREKGTRYGRS